MDDANTSVSTNSSSEPNSEGVLAGVKQQINSITGGASVTDIRQNTATVAGEKVNGLKETVVDNVVPAAGDALQSAQERISALAGKVTTGSESQVEKGMFLGLINFASLHMILTETRVWLETGHPDHQIIDQMDDEQICDFLRHKHRSTAQPPSKN